jgi:cytochrome c553
MVQTQANFKGGFMRRYFLVLALLSISPLSLAETPLRVPPDNRMVISVTAAERNQMLYEMREFLHGLHNLHHALARKDMKAVATIAKPVGPLLDRISPNLRDKLPEGFTELAVAQSEAFQTLAKIGNNNGDVGSALEQTAEIITYCSGCHDAYRFEIKAPVRPRK